MPLWDGVGFEHVDHGSKGAQPSGQDGLQLGLVAWRFADSPRGCYAGHKLPGEADDLVTRLASQRDNAVLQGRAGTSRGS